MKKLEEQNNLLIYKNKDGNIVVDAIIAVGYWVNSKKTIHFRIWQLVDYDLIKNTFRLL